MIKEIVDNWYFILILIVAIYVYAWLLDRFLFRPVMKVLDERESRSKDATAQLGAYRDSLKKRLEEYETAVLEAHRKGARIKEAARSKADADRRGQLDELKASVSVEKEGKLNKLEDEAGVVREDLASQMPAFAHKVAERLIGREVAS